MNNQSISILKKVVLTIIFTVMITTGYSQDSPEFDKLATSAGIVEMHFIGHGSLMFKFNGFVIFVDPVKSSGNYEFLPKPDLILVTHEHGDHLDTKLIEEVKKPGTLLFCNQNSLSKVPWEWQ